MRRALWLVGASGALGGCLIGWEPTLDPTDATDADADADSDADTDVGTGSTGDTACGAVPAEAEDCRFYDERVVTVGRSTHPLIASDLKFSDLYVYEDTTLLWHAWSTDGRNSLRAVEYGLTVPGAVSDGGTAAPLVIGVEYEVKLDALCDERGCAAVSSAYQYFTARN